MDKNGWVVVMLGDDGESIRRVYGANGLERRTADSLADEKNRRYARSRGLVFEVRGRVETIGAYLEP